MNSRPLQKFQSYITERAGNLICSQNWNSNFDKLAGVINNNTNIIKQNFDDIKGDKIPFDVGHPTQTIADSINTLSNYVGTLLTTDVFNQTNNRNIISIAYDGDTGTFRITKVDGTFYEIDTNIEKIPAKFEFGKNDEGEIVLKVTNDDGTYSFTDVSNIIKQYRTVDSKNIVIEEMLINGVVTSKPTIKKDSITAEELSPSLKYMFNTYHDEIVDAIRRLSDAVTEVTRLRNETFDMKTEVFSAMEASKFFQDNAKDFSNISKSYAVGNTGVRPDEEHDNSKYYCEMSKTYAEQAHDIAGGDFATNTQFNSHKDKIVYSEDGVHGIRYHLDELSLKVSNNEWINIKTGLLPEVFVESADGDEIVVSNGDKTITKPFHKKISINIPSFGDWNITIMKNNSPIKATIITIDVVKKYNVSLENVEIYGVEWNGNSNGLSRTDGSVMLTPPQSYTLNSAYYSSPFDVIKPYSDIKRVHDDVAGELVEIPKFYYKWSKNGSSLKLQISPKPLVGFYTSPAHSDRGDGKGERDKVYVGRYSCNSSYKSVSGAMPIDGFSKDEYRQNIIALGEGYYQMDYAMLVTIQMLYLVEFADWNVRLKIGRCNTGISAKTVVGKTDTMPYHTGTMGAKPNESGMCQYRYIEGLWGNAFNWLDGIYYDNGLYVQKNPLKYSSIDLSEMTFVGNVPYGYPTSFDVLNKEGYEWVYYPTGTSITIYKGLDTYVPLYKNIYFGGAFNSSHEGQYGLFALSGSSDYNGYSYTCRLQKLP